MPVVVALQKGKSRSRPFGDERGKICTEPPCSSLFLLPTTFSEYWYMCLVEMFGVFDQNGDDGSSARSLKSASARANLRGQVVTKMVRGRSRRWPAGR